MWINGLESTVPGVRGYVQKDSVSIVIEELEPKKGEYMNHNNRNEFFSLMRVSVTDDAPDIIKGTKDGGYHNYKMQNMFAFIAINPTIETIADENRIFRVNMIKPKQLSKWKTMEKQIINLVTIAVDHYLKKFVGSTYESDGLANKELTEEEFKRMSETLKDYRSGFREDGWGWW